MGGSGGGSEKARESPLLRSILEEATMATSTATLSLEKRLAAIHKQLWTAANLAYDQSLYGFGDDLMELVGFVGSLIEDLLKNGPALRKSRS
jgi:hypothetical protein